MCITHCYQKTPQFILTVLLIAVFATPTLTYALTSTPTIREGLIQAIKARAQRDVELDRKPAGVSDLEVLFGKEAKALGLTMVEVLDSYEVAYSAATPWWEPYVPAGLAAVMLFVLYILGDVVKEYLTRLFKWLAEGAYNHLAGYKPFWLIALRRYRRALLREYKELKIPFRPERPLQMGEIYVPLKATGSNSRDLVDAHTALGQHNRLMVVGAPGSGKTMLMRYIALTYAREAARDSRGQSIPILLELHRLNDSSESLLAHLTAALGRHDFPNAHGFVKAWLKHGLLLLLFDGLDEVNQEGRERVVTQIKDLLQAGPDCRVVVSCRTAVYNDEFANCLDQQMEIVEFDDRQIQRFLSAWAPEMPPGKSVEHLLHTLRERPRIMALARNPLLLTIIAYLYSDTAFVLPHSRAEFYERSTTVLLDQWDQVKQKRNQYKAAHKRLLLQGLALYYQERAGTQLQDRRSASLTDIVTEIKKALPTLNLSETHAQSILDEIVERSGLLIALDGGIRYQFTHLTLQEFFAALALKDKSEHLVAKFQADPGTWRETVKLWCGLEHDSTAFIKRIAAADPITALECLGDTQQVDSRLRRRTDPVLPDLLGETQPEPGNHNAGIGVGGRRPPPAGGNRLQEPGYHPNQCGGRAGCAAGCGSGSLAEQPAPGCRRIVRARPPRSCAPPPAGPNGQPCRSCPGGIGSGTASLG